LDNTTHVAATARLYDSVRLEPPSTVEDFCLVGVPTRRPAPEGSETVIGSGSWIRSHSVIYAGNVIGRQFVTGHKVNIRECNRIGDDVSVGTLSVIEHHVTIGNGVRIHTQAFIPEFSILEDGCWIGPNVVLTNAKYPRSRGVKEMLRGPHIGAGAKIGANATILPGISVGANALIGAGAVVVVDVPVGAVIVGNPGRQINTVERLPYGEIA